MFDLVLRALPLCFSWYNSLLRTGRSHHNMWNPKITVDAIGWSKIIKMQSWIMKLGRPQKSFAPDSKVRRSLSRIFNWLQRPYLTFEYACLEFMNPRLIDCLQEKLFWLLSNHLLSLNYFLSIDCRRNDLLDALEQMQVELLTTIMLTIIVNGTSVYLALPRSYQRSWPKSLDS